MSYQKHNFTPGAVLLASQLNDMDNEIEILSQGGSGGTVLSDDFKEALLNCFENVAWINENGQTYYGALYDSLYPDNMWLITNILTGCTTSNNATNILKNNSYVATITANEGYTLDGATVSITMGGNDVTNLYYSSGSINIPNVTGDLVITVIATSAVVSISAVFTQGSAVIYDTDSLDTLKQYLTVTANYADSTTATVSDYTLSGTLTEGTSTVTVSYGGKTDTFDVVVTWGFRIRNAYANNPTVTAITGDINTSIYVSSNNKRAGLDPAAYKLPAGSYTVTCPTAYYFGLQVSKIADSTSSGTYAPIDEVDYSWTGEIKTFWEGTAARLVSSGWQNGTYDLTITDDAMVVTNFKKGSAGTSALTSRTDLDAIRDGFTIVKVNT